MHRPPFLVRILPAALRSRLRESVMRHIVWAVDKGAVHSGVIDGKHLPIAPGADSYILPIEPREDASSPDGMPIPPKELWWDYAKTADRYLEIGRVNIEKMRAILRTGGGDIRPGDRILDFGCAAGPQVRCLREFAEAGEVWGVDVSAAHVAWCQRALPECFHFATTTTSPHLPFEDRHFDLIFCGSVFSHISEMADAWLLELSRIIRPGGRLYVTVNSRQSMYAYLKRWPELEFSRHVRGQLTKEQIESDFGEAVVGRSVWQHSVFDLRVFNRKCEQAHFKVVSVNRNTYSFQTAILLERMETRRPEEVDAAPHVVVRARAAQPN